MKVLCATKEDLFSLFAPDIRSVWVSSPWISTEGVDLLRQSLSRGGSSRLSVVDIWVRLNLQDRWAGLTDYFALDQLRRWLLRVAPGVRISFWTSPALHAKIVWTDHGALIGSGNLTKAGYESNVEAAVRLDASECAGQASFRKSLEARMEVVREDRWCQFVEETVQAESAPMPREPIAPPSAEGWQEFLGALLSEQPPHLRGFGFR